MKNRTQGYALIAVLFAVLLVAGMVAITAALSTSEDSQSGNNMAVARTRAAAEAGQADVTFYMTNQGLTDINTALDYYATNFSYSNGDASKTAIIQPSQYSAVLATLNGLNGTTISGTANGVTYDANIQYTGMDVDQNSFTSSGQVYVLNYTSTANARVAAYKRTVTTRGQLQIQMGRKFINQYVLLADDAGASGGNFFATGMEYDGPVHVNTNWKFSGKPSFKYGAETNDSTVGMYNCSKKAYQSVKSQSNDCTQPNWGGYGLKYQAGNIPLPTNALSQQNAALGLDPTLTTAPSNYQECQALGKASPIASCTTSSIVGNGVYVPYNAAKVVTGGIYIKGDATSVNMSVSGNKQIYTITAAGATTTITVDYSLNTTTLIQGKTTTVLTGVLSGDPKATGVANGMIYSTGSILSMTGPSRPSTAAAKALDTSAPDVPDQSVLSPAIAAKSQINVAAAKDITIQSDIIYEQDPRTVANAKNVLGLMAGTGSVHIGSSAPKNVYVQAALLAGGNNQGFAVDGYNSGAPRGQIHLLGSVAEDVDPPRGIGSADGTVINNGYGDAFRFDPRFMNGGAVPPYFPATKKFAAQSVWPNQQGWQEN